MAHVIANFAILVLVVLIAGAAFFLMWSAVKEKSESTGFRITYIVLSVILFLIAIVPASFLK